MSTVGGSSDQVVNLAVIKEKLRSEPGGVDLDPTELERKARDVALERGRTSAKNEVINKRGECDYTHVVIDTC